MNRTEQQEFIVNELKNLIVLSKTKLVNEQFEIRLVPLFEQREDEKSECFIYKNKVILKLVEQKNQDNLEDWARPIIDCYNQLKRIENDNVYKRQNPNFFEALKTIIELEQNQK
jgi:hypothetical protein